MGRSGRTAMLVFLGTVAVLLLVSCSGAAAKSFEVGGDGRWEYQQNDTTFYTDWAKNQSFTVGDVIEFKYNATVHDVAPVTLEVFNNCSTANAVAKNRTGDTSITLSTPGYKWYICTIGDHCEKQGMKVALSVGGPVAAPSPAPEAPPPAHNAAPRLAGVIGYGAAAAVVISAASLFL